VTRSYQTGWMGAPLKTIELRRVWIGVNVVQNKRQTPSRLIHAARRADPHVIERAFTFWMTGGHPLETRHNRVNLTPHLT
jgi:hypothetical protein